MPEYIALKRMSLREGEGWRVWQPGDPVASSAFEKSVLKNLIAKGAVGVQGKVRKRKEDVDG